MEYYSDIPSIHAQVAGMGKGQAIFRAGVAADAVYRVIEGEVHLVRRTPGGAEIILQRVKRLAGIGLAGHVPIVILTDGKQQCRRKDGSITTFVNFPAVKESPPGIRGDWQIADMQDAITERMGKPNVGKAGALN